MSIALSWDVKAQCQAWSPQLLASVGEYFQSMELGAPENFVAGYEGLSSEDKLKFWAEIIIGMIKYESNFDPHCIYHEPPPLGVDSVGLLQLSYEDQVGYGLEALDREEKSLEDPLVNIRCGVKIFAHWVAKDHVVSTGASKQSRGAARYWSVMREGHHVEDIKSRVRSLLGL